MDGSTATATFRCSFGRVFDLSELPGWVAAEQHAGNIPAADTVDVTITHPDKEVQDACRWCGERKDGAVFTIRNGSRA